MLCTEDKGDQHPDAHDTLYISVPASADGFSISGDWNPLGMCGTVNRNLAFKDVFVGDDEQLMPRGIYFRGAQTWPAMFFTLSPTYLGIANAAYDFTVRYLRGEAPGEPPVKRRQYRDSRYGALMPPRTAELILDRMGRETLYEAGERDE